MRRRSMRSRLHELVDWMKTKQIVEKEMTEEECRRAVKKLARDAIADRARVLHRAGLSPGKALRQARAEYKSQFGGFR